MTGTYAERLAVVCRDEVCLGIARKFRADNLAFVAGGERPAAGLMMGILADRIADMGVEFHPGYLTFVMASLCGRIANG